MKRIAKSISQWFMLLTLLSGTALLTACADSSQQPEEAAAESEIMADEEPAEETLTEVAATEEMSTEEVSTEEVSMEEVSMEEVIEIGKTESKEGWTQTEAFSKEIQDTFIIDVCLPKDYDPDRQYPVVYLTDCYWRRGDYPAITELYESGEIGEFILIGIGYPDDYDFDTIRERDLIQEPDAFLRMIVRGVMPYVESEYSIDKTDRTFCGASYGGYFMIYSLFQEDGLTEGLFRNYILASPVFGEYTHGIPLADREDNYYRASKDHRLDVNIYLTVGGDEDEGAFLRPIRNFVTRMEKRGYEGLNLTYKEYEGMGHYDVWVPSLLDGLRLLMKK